MFLNGFSLRQITGETFKVTLDILVYEIFFMGKCNLKTFPWSYEISMYIILFNIYNNSVNFSYAKYTWIPKVFFPFQAGSLCKINDCLLIKMVCSH